MRGRRSLLPAYGANRVTVPLPEYEVARVDTGQFSDSEGNVWGGGFSLSGE